MHIDSKAHWFQNSSIIWVYLCQCFLLYEKQHTSVSVSCNPKQPWSTLYCRMSHRASPWAMKHSFTQQVRKSYYLYSSLHHIQLEWFDTIFQLFLSGLGTWSRCSTDLSQQRQVNHHIPRQPKLPLYSMGSTVAEGKPPHPSTGTWVLSSRGAYFSPQAKGSLLLNVMFRVKIN